MTTEDATGQAREPVPPANDIITINAGATLKPMDSANTLILDALNRVCDKDNPLESIADVEINAIHGKRFHRADTWNGLSVYSRLKSDGIRRDWWLCGAPIWVDDGFDVRLQVQFRCVNDEPGHRNHFFTMRVVGTPQVDALKAQTAKMQRWFRGLALYLAPDADTVRTALHWTDEILGRTRPASTTTAVPANPAARRESGGE